MGRTQLLAAAAGAIAATALAGGIAWAAIPEGGVIQGCYNENNGQLRVVDAATDCGPSELGLSWNQTALKAKSVRRGRREKPGHPGLLAMAAHRVHLGRRARQGRAARPARAVHPERAAPQR